MNIHQHKKHANEMLQISSQRVYSVQNVKKYLTPFSRMSVHVIKGMRFQTENITSVELRSS